MVSHRKRTAKKLKAKGVGRRKKLKAGFINLLANKLLPTPSSSGPSTSSIMSSIAKKIAPDIIGALGNKAQQMVNKL